MNGETRFLIGCCLVMAACLTGAGCGASHPVHYYKLASAAPHPGPSQADGPTMLVANITTTEALQDFRIRYHAGGNEVGAYEYYHWTEEPGAMVRDALIQSLRASGKYKWVLQSSSSGAGDYLVRGRLYEFDEVDAPAIHARISLQVELIDKKTSRVIWTHQLERDEPAAGKTMDEVVAAMDRDLGQVAGQAAEAIGQAVGSAKPEAGAGG